MDWQGRGNGRKCRRAENDQARICGETMPFSFRPLTWALIWPFASEQGELTLDKSGDGRYVVGPGVLRAEQEIQIGRQAALQITLASDAVDVLRDS